MALKYIPFSSFIIQYLKDTTKKWFGGDDYFRINYMFYAAGGVWSLKKKHVQDSKLSLLVLYFMRLLIPALYIWVFVGMIYDFLILFGDVKKLTYSLSSSFFFMGLVGRNIVLCFFKDELEDCLDLVNSNFYLDFVGKCERDWRILKNGETAMKKLSLVFYIFAVISVAARAICHLLAPSRMLMIPYPFDDMSATPDFEILFVVQTFGVIHFVMVVVFYEMVIYGFFIKILNHFEIIQKNLTEIRYPGYDTKRRDPLETIKYRLSIGEKDMKNLQYQREPISILLKNVIIHHQEIYKVMKRMDSLLRHILFIQIFGGGIILSILCVDLIWQSKKITSKLISQCFYAAACVFDITFLCFFGTKVETASIEAANLLYDTPWTEMDIVSRKIMKFHLKALWRYPKITASGIAPINLNTYVTFLNFIYNSIAFMKHAASRHEVLFGTVPINE